MDRVPLKTEVDVQPNTAESTPTTETDIKPNIPPTRLGFMDYPDYHRFADFFDVSLDERKDDNIADKLNELWQWGEKETGDSDRLQISMTLKALAKRIGYPDVGPTLIKKLYQWIRLDTDRKRIEEKMDTLSITQNATQTS